MTDILAADASLSKFAPESRFRRSRKTIPSNSVVASVMRVAQRLWPVKTDIELSVITKANDRTCRFWLSNKSGMHADHLVALMRKDPAKFVPAVLGREAYAALVADLVEQARIEKLEADHKATALEIERLRKTRAR
jgi:hypothetical protein